MYVNIKLVFLYRNRVAVQLQKNLDRQRLKRIAHKLSASGAPPVIEAAADRKASAANGSRTGGLLGPLPGQLSSIPRQKSPGEVEAGDDDEYEYEEEEESGDK